LAAVEAILGAIVTSQTHRIAMSQPKHREIIIVAQKYWLSFCFPCAAYEIRRNLDLVLLTNQNGRYFYKTHLVTLFIIYLPNLRKKIPENLSESSDVKLGQMIRFSLFHWNDK